MLQPDLWKDLAAELLNQQGFLVISSNNSDYKPGYILPSLCASDSYPVQTSVPHPFCVTGPATYEEWKTQRALGASFLRDKVPYEVILDTELDPENRYYYKVTTD